MARFYDGLTPQPHTLRLSLTERALIGRNAEQDVLLQWAFADILVLEEPLRDREAVLSCNQSPEARLRIPPADFERLRPYLLIESCTSHAMRWMGVSVAAITVVVLAFLSWAQLAPTIARMIPEEKLEPLSREAMDAVVGGAKDCAEEKPFAELQAVVASLAKAGGYEGPIKLRVIDKNDTNAFALPGGHIVVFRPVITDAESVDEIAGVLAHEIGHLKGGHAREAIVRHLGMSFVFQVFAGVDDASHVLMLAEHMGEMHHSRKAELQADHFALEMTSAAGYDPKALGAFFTRLQKEEEGGSGIMDSEIFNYVSSHPATTERKERIRTNELVPNPKAKPSRNLALLKSICSAPPPAKSKKK